MIEVHINFEYCLKLKWGPGVKKVEKHCFKFQWFQLQNQVSWLPDCLLSIYAASLELKLKLTLEHLEGTWAVVFLCFPK